MAIYKASSVARMAGGLWIGLTMMLVVAVSWTQAQTQTGEQRSRPEAPEPPEKPNVVIFMIDTLRADRLGIYGYDRRPTSPRIDELAREAVVFEQACAPSPWTLPTVVSLMTSTFPCEHGTLNDRHMLSKQLMPLAERMQRLRYTTLGLYSNPFAGPDYGLDRGFNVLQPDRNSGGEKVGRLLGTYPNKPLFLYIHNIEPHTPHHYAPKHTDGFRDIPREIRRDIKKNYVGYRSLTRIDFFENQPLGTTDNTQEQDRRMAALTSRLDDYNELYDAAVRLADTRVGTVIDELKRRGYWENTLFILLSDHGEEMNEHGGWLHDQSVYEELVHVPLIVRFPRGQYAGRRVQSVVTLVDVLPTIFDFLKQPRFASGARGRSLMPLVRGESSAEDEDFLIASMRINTKKYYRPRKESRGDINLVVRHGNWKGIWNVEPKTLELYNLASDPGEQHDVSSENTEMSLVMKLFARQYHEKCRERSANPPERTIQLDDETLEKLRSLGYVD